MTPSGGTPEQIAWQAVDTHFPYKVSAIKEVRDALDCGLREAKALVDAAWLQRASTGDDASPVMALQKNKHGNHTATCLCCVHFEYVAETGPYSDMTPGDSAYLSCQKGVFIDVFSPDEDDYHRTCLIGESCTEFSARS